MVDNAIESMLSLTFPAISAKIGTCFGKICDDIGDHPDAVSYPQFSSAYSLVTKCWQLFLRPWYVCISRAMF